MLKVGLTGGIGSGKTMVADIFQVLGIPVYNADMAARKIMETDADTIRFVKSLFGEQAYLGSKLNRPFISNAIFHQPVLRNQLNQQVHPKTIADAEAWLQSCTTSFAIKEAALIFESGGEKNLDVVMGVTAPLSLRINRVMKRDGIDEATALLKINSQMDEAEKMRRCDYVIHNNEMDLLIPQVELVYKQLLHRAQST